MGKLPAAQPIPFDLIGKMINSNDPLFFTTHTYSINGRNYSEHNILLMGASKSLLFMFGKVASCYISFGRKYEWVIYNEGSGFGYNPPTVADVLPQDAFEKFTPEQKKLYLKHIDIFSGSNEL